MEIQPFVSQLDVIIAAHASMGQRSERHDLSDLPKHERQAIVTRAISAVHRISGINSSYSQEITRIQEINPQLHNNASTIIGVALALRDDLQAGYVQNLTEMIHTGVYSDFLEMARLLVDSGYKDAAAVIAGSTLESHLRKLAAKFSIPVIIEDRSVKADKLNAVLVELPAYSVLDQRNVTAWLDLGNKAAHGNYNDYTKDQIVLLVSAIQDFITRNPA
jgi:hypothetical protein